METIEIGLAYECRAIGIKNEVVGIVEQLYNNTILINVLDCDQSDRAAIIELQNRLLVKYEDILSYIEVEYTAWFLGSWGKIIMEEKDLDLLMDSDLFLLNMDGKNLINRIKKYPNHLSGKAAVYHSSNDTWFGYFCVLSSIF